MKPLRLRAKIRYRLTAGIVAIMFNVLFYNWIVYHDSPLRECEGVPGTYCGKTNRLHSYDDYRIYLLLEKVQFALWPVGMLGIFLLNRDRFRW